MCVLALTVLLTEIIMLEQSVLDKLMSSHLPGFTSPVHTQHLLKFLIILLQFRLVSLGQEVVNARSQNADSSCNIECALRPSSISYRGEHLRAQGSSSFAEASSNPISHASCGCWKGFTRDEPDCSAWAHVTKSLEETIENHESWEVFGSGEASIEAADDEAADYVAADKARYAGPATTDPVDEVGA